MKLIEMFWEIEKYHKILGYDFGKATPEEQMNAIRDSGLALNQEVAELIDSFPWKPWRPIGFQKWDTNNAVEEIIDIFFFLGQIMEAAYINPRKLEEMFDYKLKENYNRINRGYNNTPEERR